MELNIFVSKQDLINGPRTTAHSAINHALFMINIPADQLSGEVWTGVAFWLKLNTRHIVSSALNKASHSRIPAFKCVTVKSYAHIFSN